MRVGIGNRLVEVTKEATPPDAATVVDLVRQLGEIELEARLQPDAEHIAAVMAKQAELRRAREALGTTSTSPGLVMPDSVPRHALPGTAWYLPNRR